MAASVWPGLRRAVQGASLALFLFCCWSVAWPLPDGPTPADLFLRLDPAAAVLTTIASRHFIVALVPGIVVLACTLIAGRFFCGWICPYGATLDIVRRLWGRRRKTCQLPRRLPALKFVVLAAMTGTALLGVNTVFWGAPIPLLTRAVETLVHPLATLLAQSGLDIGSPLLEGFPQLAYLEVTPRRYEGMLFIACLFGACCWLEAVYPRFWCRCLCPSGALMALLSRRPILRRRVSEGCRGCERCVRICPTQAISDDPGRTNHEECLTCQRCRGVCPDGSIAFGTVPRAIAAPPAPSHSPSRRAFLGSGAMGIVLAGIQYSGTGSLMAGDGKGTLLQPWVVRPPGALPEPDFLRRCLRCGLCMKACPTNGLQPAWTLAGAEALFSPILVPRRGPCDPACHACGQVCPTGAVASLVPEEKQWAKVGTAVVLRERCLAWAEGRKCVVCQEVCPYGAVALAHTEQTAVPAPVVKGVKCYGCGYCEKHCPVRIPAIRVEPLNALRLATTDYKAAAQEAGLSLEVGKREGGEMQDTVPEGELPPGFSD
ncbi:MAG: 4Fe-4S binding protein [Desulfovibrio sp.]|jgi:MauM/NapG family ferredoxin protein|nr:4Fe-4S binding protein [Desulfovibrio sp.]